MSASVTDVRPVEHIARLRGRVDEALTHLVPTAKPSNLYDPVRYVLEGRGKRLRPLLLLLSAEMYEVDAAQALPAALAVEVFHNFTLVHDDIMDHADARRGRPTVHVKWDERDAILAGDLMMALAYDLLAQLDTPRLGAIVRSFHRMVVRLCEGQALDKDFELRTDVTLDDYLAMIERKTGALLETTLVLGGLIGQARPEELEQLEHVGRHLGRAFQIQDDLLDLTAEDVRWGKRIGGDLIEGKKTYLLLKAVERAAEPDLTWFKRITEQGGLPPEDVPAARARMQKLGVLDETRTTLLNHYRLAQLGLDALPQSPAADTLRWLVADMQSRVR